MLTELLIIVVDVPGVAGAPASVILTDALGEYT
jgi:hypothetical protein